MAAGDRDYYRDGPGGGGFTDNPLRWLLAGRVPLFRVFGVNVQAHASLIVVTVFVLVFGQPFGDSLLDRVTFIAVLFGVVLLHEFGHVFAARWSGGSAEEILMTPLGGLALVMPGKGWRRHTITVAGGPLVNVVICLVAGAILYALAGYLPLGPYSFGTYRVLEEGAERPAWFAAAVTNGAFYAYYVYSVSYFLLLFNLLPIFPLDGGQLLQGLLWWRIGWYKATLWATSVGMVGAILLGLWGVATLMGGVLLIFIAASCFFNCLNLHRQLKAEGEWAFTDQDEDWSASFADDKPSWAERRAERRERARRERTERDEAAEREELDRVLAKVSQIGLDGLTKAERRVLEDATAKRRG